jgi:TPP-dependent pyruvate/acetoin dehydrogenase alpha subunit
MHWAVEREPDRRSMTAITSGSEPDVNQLSSMLRSMLEIRFFEEEIQNLFTKGLVRGSTHLCQGQEAVAVGVSRALKPGDGMVCTYRGHGEVLAMGAPLDRSFAEILGRRQGLCGGKGGSMHLADVSVGAYGSFAIVGSHLPIAVGIAFAAAYRQTDAVSICFFGDGTTNIGAFHESLNLASIWRLPTVFVCENNLYGEYSAIATTTAIDALADRADAYRMAKDRVDGNDVVAMYRAAERAVAHARSGQGPTLIEALTYRHRGHSRSDPAVYRPKGELEEWLKRDPILLLENRLTEATQAEAVKSIRAKAEADVKAALERALSWPDPDLATRFENVLA